MTKLHAPTTFYGCALSRSLRRRSALAGVSENRLMNRRVRFCVGFIFGCALVANSALAQSLPGGSTGQALPLNIKNATNANDFAPQIRQFIQDQISHLQSADIAGQTLARKKVIDECPGSGGASASFYAVYAREWSAAAKPLIAAGNPLRLRLNVAIASAALAENGKSLALEPIIEVALADREGSVALWGIKAARPLILVVLQAPDVIVSGRSTPALAVSKLVTALVDTVKSHEKSDVSGFIVLDAYHALVIRDIPGRTDDQVKPLLRPLVDPVLSVLEFRVSQYAQGAISSPGAEREVTTFLSSNYGAAGPNQKRIRQDLVTLVTYSGQRASLYASNRQDLSQLREMLKYASQALWVIAGQDPAVKELRWLRENTSSAPVSDIDSKTRQVWAILNPLYKDLVQPAPIPVILAPPTSAPAAPAPPAPPASDAPVGP